MEINNKPRVVIWFVSNDNRFIGNAKNILEKQFNGVDLIGVTANTKITVKDETGRELPFLPLNELSQNGGGYDIFLVAGGRPIGMSEITKFARAIKLDENKLLADWIVCIPGFELKKYRQLQRSQLSIFSINCFGGSLSHTLALPFRSPFVNLYLSNKDFVKFLENPHFYFGKELVYHGQKMDSKKTYYFPVAAMDDVLLNMMHYKNFEDSVINWEKRKTRINWYNLFVVMWATSQEELEKFDSLPYGKKACFVPFESDLDSAFYVNPKIRSDLNRFVDIFNDSANGNPFYYDPFDMLLYGKKTQIIEM